MPAIIDPRAFFLNIYMFVFCLLVLLEQNLKQKGKATLVRLDLVMTRTETERRTLLVHRTGQTSTNHHRLT